MAATVNGFGYGGDVGGQRGDYIIRVINAGSAVLNNISNASNNTPAAGDMQKLLDIPGPGRLLLLAPYASSNSLSSEVRIRVDADDRVIYKACKGNHLFEYFNDNGGYYGTGDGLPKVIFTPGFFVDAGEFAALNGAYPGKFFILRKDKYFPGYTFGPNNDPYALIHTETIFAQYNRSAENCVEFHAREDDNRIGQLDYWRSAFLDGLFFDGNLTIRAAYSVSPSAYYKNGIVVVYQLFDE